MKLGYFVSGVPVWDWSDTVSYNNAGVWYNLAMEFEQYDMDVCLGHAASGTYHRKYFVVIVVHLPNEFLTSLFLPTY
jgi:hypothetical protein